MAGLLLLVATALGQEVPAEIAPDAPPRPPAPEAVSFGDKMVWAQEALPDTEEALTSIAIEPDARVWLVADADGTVFRSPDAGGSWSEVLEGVPRVAAPDETGPSMEKRLLDAESARDEEVGNPEDAVDEGDTG